MKLGVIADDFTGATDIASFLVQGGLATVQINGVPSDDLSQDTSVQAANAIVISLKSRSCPAQQAVDLSLAAWEWLDRIGTEYIFFKYCSTFDSTETGNIGPVLDALCKVMGEPQAVLCPALPVNQRSVYKGHLFVGSCLLHESHMRYHPVNPMKTARLASLLEPQAKYQNSCGLLDWETLQQGCDSIRAHLQDLRQQGLHYVVCDAICNRDLELLAEALADRMRLFSGGSGLAWGLARHLAKGLAKQKDRRADSRILPPSRAASIILAGSCSKATLEQVRSYEKLVSAFAVDVLSCAKDPQAYANNAVEWFEEQQANPYAPMIYSSAEPIEVQNVQKTLGKEESQQVVESFFSLVAVALQQCGVQNFLIAGGETSGAVVQALQIQGFIIGESIAPGVPWVQSLNGTTFLTLKSGNFGDEDFFCRAQDMLPGVSL